MIIDVAVELARKHAEQEVTRMSDSVDLAPVRRPAARRRRATARAPRRSPTRWSSTRTPPCSCRRPSCRRGSTRATPIVGAKLGLTSTAKQKQMNVDRPLYGWLTADMADRHGRAAAVRPLHPAARASPRSRSCSVATSRARTSRPRRCCRRPRPCSAPSTCSTRGYAGYKFTFNDVTADNASSAGLRPRRHGARPVRHRPAPHRLRAGEERRARLHRRRRLRDGAPGRRGRLAGARARAARAGAARRARSSWPAA